MRAPVLCLVAFCACSGSGDDPIVELSPVTAQIDARCRTADRIGVVALTGSADQISLRAQLSDDKHPLLGEPTLADEACELHEFAASFCEGCELGEICGPAGSCVAAPRPGRQISATVTSGGESQRFEESDQLGFLFGDVTLRGRARLRRVSLLPLAVCREPIETASTSLRGDSTVGETSGSPSSC